MELEREELGLWELASNPKGSWSTYQATSLHGQIQHSGTKETPSWAAVYGEEGFFANALGF